MRLILALVVAEITSSFEVSMIYAALASLIREFGDPARVGWMITAYLLVGSVAAALCSRLGDLFGRRRLVLAMLACSLCGSLISLTSTSLTGLIMGRSLQGMSAALLPLCIGLVREHLSGDRVPVAIGWLAAMASFSAGLGILLGGVFVDHLGWRWIFGFSTGHGLLAILLVLAFVPGRKVVSAGVRRRIDWLGGLLYAPAIAAMLWAISRIKTHGLGDTTNLGALLGGAALLALWARWEWHHPDPMIDVRRIGDRQIGLAMVLMLLFGLGTSQLMLVLMLLAQQPLWTGVGLGLSATLAGAIKLPSNFMGLVGAPWSGRIAARDGARRAALLAAIIICAGWVGLTGWHTTPWWLVGWALIISFGGAMLFAAVPNLIVEVAPPERTSEIIGLTQVVRTIGSAVGTQLASLLLVLWTVSNPAQGPGSFPSGQAYPVTFIAITATCSVSLLAALALRRNPHGAGGSRAE
ncbi:MAG: MFS transporter [Burkholderiaceae bacterium]